jgi:electron-transferring-flavoprotein dehydrogenase
MLGGLDMWINTLFGVSVFGTLNHGKADHAALEKPPSQADRLSQARRRADLRPLSSVFLSNTNHEEDQPVHLKLEDRLQKSSELDVYAGPSAAIARQAFMNGWK